MNSKRIIVKNMKYDYLVVGALVAVTLATGAFLSATKVSADETKVSKTASVTVPDACTMTGTGMNTHTAEVANGNYVSEIGSTTLKITCNDGGGFSVYAIGFTGDEYEGEDHTKLIGTSTGQKIITGTATGAGSSDVSNWAMKVGTDAGATYPLTLDNSFGSYHAVPDTYTKVAYRNSGTDIGLSAIGSELTTTYAAYVSRTQTADTYNGKVKYILVHPSDADPYVMPQITAAGKICYYPDGSTTVGRMGCQTVSASATSKTLLASNFSRAGYGFAGWNDKFDYSGNFYGPNEDIVFVAGQYTSPNNGLSLYAVWVKSVGSLQDPSKVASTCSDLTIAPTDSTATLTSVSALTDTRDNQTYAIAKLADGKCWMIENLRLDNTAELTLANTNNPLNNGANVTLKHNYTDTDTYNTLSATSSVAYNADTAPDGWCTTYSAACVDQSRLRTDNTANRATYTSGQIVSSQDANIYSYGNYYNWYSATAGNGTYDYNTNNNSVSGDLCPAGWRLPKGGNKTRIESDGDNEFWNLIVVALNNNILPANYISRTYPFYNGTTEAGPVGKALRAYPNNYLYAGHVYGGSHSFRGSFMDLWSSTAYNSNHVYSLLVDSSRVIPGSDYFDKASGRSVRCIAQ